MKKNFFIGPMAVHCFDNAQIDRINTRQGLLKTKTVVKKTSLLLTGLICSFLFYGQTYPDPEFSNEVYALKKGNSPSLVRLEKNSSKQETKVKLGGFAGAEHGYTVEGQKSPVRLSGANLSFVFSTGASANAKSDSTLRASGIDPNMFAGMGMDPSTMISLYKTDSDKGMRKIYLVKNSGAFGGKNKASDKYSFSLKKIRDGYWELVPDKPLPVGEYAFVVMGFTTDGAHSLFAFGIDGWKSD